MSAWATAALPWFQIVGTFATAIAAIAAWRSANAASLAADRADRTAQRGRRDPGPVQAPEPTGPRKGGLEVDRAGRRVVGQFEQ